MSGQSEPSTFKYYCLAGKRRDEVSSHSIELGSLGRWSEESEVCLREENNLVASGCTWAAETVYLVGSACP